MKGSLPYPARLFFPLKGSTSLSTSPESFSEKGIFFHFSQGQPQIPQWRFSSPVFLEQTVVGTVPTDADMAQGVAACLT